MERTQLGECKRAVAFVKRREREAAREAVEFRGGQRQKTEYETSLNPFSPLFLYTSTAIACLPVLPIQREILSHVVFLQTRHDGRPKAEQGR